MTPAYDLLQGGMEHNHPLRKDVVLVAQMDQQFVHAQRGGCGEYACQYQAILRYDGFFINGYCSGSGRFARLILHLFVPHKD